MAAVSLELRFFLEPTANHFVKMLMEGISWQEYFRNEIAWKRSRLHSDAQSYTSTPELVNHKIDCLRNGNLLQVGFYGLDDHGGKREVFLFRPPMLVK